MTDKLIETIREALARHASLDEVADILRHHREQGISQESASRALEKLRSAVDDATEDRVLEIMDVVSGYCAERLRVWSKKMT